MRGQGNLVDAVISVVIVSLLILVAFALFDPLTQMGPQSGQLGEANQNFTEAASILPLAVGSIGLLVTVFGILRMRT